MTADSSVIIAALSGWHADHEAADEATATVTELVAHAELEAYSVMTRLPAPSDLPGELVAQALRARFPGRRLVLGAAGRRDLVERLAGRGVSGGAAYDGLIALTAAEHGRTLLTLDRRAVRTYERVGAPYALVG